MKMFIVLTMLALSTACLAGEQSVLVNKESTPATTPAASAAVVVSSCCGSCLYNSEEQVTSSCRKRIRGGYVQKDTVRKVYRPVR